MIHVCLACGHPYEGLQHVCVKPFAFDSTKFSFDEGKCPHRIVVTSSHICDHASTCDCRKPGFCRVMSTSTAVPVAPLLQVPGCTWCDADPNTSSPEVLAVVRWLERVAALQVQKNRKYGSSVSAPVRIFSKSDEVEGIKVRIDDKLSRIRAGAADEDEDVLLDLVGYLAWLATAKK